MEHAPSPESGYLVDRLIVDLKIAGAAAIYMIAGMGAGISGGAAAGIAALPDKRRLDALLDERRDLLAARKN